MTIDAGVELPEAAMVEICRRRQVRVLSLFGSAARGEMRPDSDVDLRVDFLPGARLGLLGVSAMMRETCPARPPGGPRRQARTEPLIRATVLDEARLIYAA
jgi:hypothetical protein